jgi:hypothetical protein
VWPPLELNKPSTLTILRQLALASELSDEEPQQLLNRLIDIVVAQTRGFVCAAVPSTNQSRDDSRLSEKPFFETDMVVEAVTGTTQSLVEQKASPSQPLAAINKPTSASPDEDRKDEIQELEEVQDEHQELEEKVQDELTTPAVPTPTPATTPVAPTSPPPATPNTSWQKRVRKEVQKTGQTPWKSRSASSKKRKQKPTPTPKTTPSPSAKGAKPSEASSTPSRPNTPITLARVQLAARMASALENSDSSASESDESLAAGYETPDTDDWEEPDRDPQTDDFCDRAYESKVREHQHAIKKAYPRLLFGDETKVERTRLLQDYLADLARRNGEDFFDKAVRQWAERHVRWQTTPKQAYKLLVRATEKRKKSDNSVCLQT